jgi:hypothetical protein
MSHPFVERLIGSVRRELLDHTLFWAAIRQIESMRSTESRFLSVLWISPRQVLTMLVVPVLYAIFYRVELD